MPLDVIVLRKGLLLPVVGLPITRTGRFQSTAEVPRFPRFSPARVGTPE